MRSRLVSNEPPWRLEISLETKEDIIIGWNIVELRDHRRDKRRYSALTENGYSAAGQSTRRRQYSQPSGLNWSREPNNQQNVLHSPSSLLSVVFGAPSAKTLVSAIAT